LDSFPEQGDQNDLKEPNPLAFFKHLVGSAAAAQRMQQLAVALLLAFTGTGMHRMFQWTVQLRCSIVHRLLPLPLARTAHQRSLVSLTGWFPLTTATGPQLHLNFGGYGDSFGPIKTAQSANSKIPIQGTLLSRIMNGPGAL